MDTINRDYIETYLQSLITKEDIKLQEFRLYCEENSLPIIHKEVGQFIKFLINLKKATNILEVGTNVGFSSIFMSMVMDYKGHVVTLEKNEKFYKESLKNIERFNLSSNIQVIHGDAIEKLDSVEGFFDIAFIDAAKSHYKVFFDKCISKMHSGGIVISDNVLFKGMVANDELINRRNKTITRNLRVYLQYISNDERFVTSVLPLGDGIAVTFIK